MLTEPSYDIQMNYDQMMRTYMRPVYTEQRDDLNRLKSILY